MTDGSAFSQACAVEHAAFNTLVGFAEKLWAGCEVISTADSRRLQKLLGDVIISHDGGMKSIEFKVEREHTGNLFLETWSNKSRGTPGWFVTSLATDLWYYFLDAGLLYICRLRALQDWARQNDRIATFPERVQRKYAQANDTWGRLVPVAVLREELAGAFISRQVPVEPAVSPQGRRQSLSALLCGPQAA